MKKSIKISALILLGILIVVSCDSPNTSKDANGYSGASETKNVKVEIDYLTKGKNLAAETKSNLGKNLIMAIAQKGSDGAVEFCNIEAIPIIDSMSLVLNAKIKRVSDKPRNPNNQANEAELSYIKNWKDAKINGEEHPPMLSEINGKMVGYYAITTNQMCMQCHGKPDVQIKTPTLKRIKDLYPADQAIGYTENEIRGIFVVEMNKE